MNAVNPVENLIKVFGTQVKLAEKIGVSQETISYWLKTSRIPRHRLLEVESKTGVSRRFLAPELFNFGYENAND